MLLMNIASVISKISLIRAKIAPVTNAPEIFAVTSARADDGTRVLSHLLGESFYASGDSTIVVEFSDEGDRLLRMGQRIGRDLAYELNLHIIKRSEIGPNILRVYMAENGVLPGYKSVQALFTELSQDYQVMIVDAAQPMHHPHALFCLMLSTQTLIAVRKGRALCVEDRQLCHGILEPSKSLGVVTLEAALIDRERPMVLPELRQKIQTLKGEQNHSKPVLERL